MRPLRIVASSRSLKSCPLGPSPSYLETPFAERENLTRYLAACTKLGVRATDSFQVVALYEEQVSLEASCQGCRTETIGRRL